MLVKLIRSARNLYFMIPKKLNFFKSDDSFETRGKLWEIRKKEKLLGQEVRFYL